VVFPLLISAGKKKGCKRKAADKVADILTDYIHNQDIAMEKLQKAEREQFQMQLAAEKEMRQQEFQQNLTMMKSMMDMFAATTSTAGGFWLICL
jgi:hypothetical protein